MVKKVKNVDKMNQNGEREDDVNDNAIQENNQRDET